MAWTRAKMNEDASGDDQGGQSTPTKVEPDVKLEDAVRRSMNDLEQEGRSTGDADRSRPNAS